MKPYGTTGGNLAVRLKIAFADLRNALFNVIKFGAANPVYR